MAVQVSMILERKGRDVITIRPDAMLLFAVDKLSQHGVGALVVSADGRTVDGIISERDVVAELARLGTGAVKRSVAQAMSTGVTTCSSSATVDDLMTTMTQQRIRHIPIVDDGQLAGIVSIGDVVKVRLDELEIEKASLEQYVTGTA